MATARNVAGPREAMSLLRRMLACLTSDRCRSDRSERDGLRELQQRTRRASRQASVLRQARERNMTREAALDFLFRVPPER